MYLFLVTVLPPILIIGYFYLSDKFREPTQLLSYTFFLGILITIPAGILNSFFSYSFLAGFTEEPLKFLVLYYFVRKRKSFNEPMDAIVYGVTISLGFATLENLQYVYLLDFEDPLYIAYLRAFSAIPMHAMCGVIMGFYFGMHAFRNKRFYLARSLLIPIILHASYNFFTNFGPLFIVILFVMFFIAYSLFSQLKKMQSEKSNEEEQKFI